MASIQKTLDGGQTNSTTKKIGAMFQSAVVVAGGAIELGAPVQIDTAADTNPDGPIKVIQVATAAAMQKTIGVYTRNITNPQGTGTLSDDGGTVRLRGPAAAANDEIEIRWGITWARVDGSGTPLARGDLLIGSTGVAPTIGGMLAGSEELSNQMTVYTATANNDKAACVLCRGPF
jgi:hypothetical protein